MEKHTVNPCKACAPLGAALAMKGIENSMCILHGSQGCATYIRRFFIGHFREPVDIASSSFDEGTAVFGGKGNLLKGIGNIISGYDPDVIGIATSCLAETIGEDINLYMNDIKKISNGAGSRKITFIHTDTAAYKGTHVDGFMKMTAAAAALAEKPLDKAAEELPLKNPERFRLNVFPWLVSPADIRHLKRIIKDMNIDAVFLPDYSMTLDGGSWTGYEAIPRGGTPVEAIRRMGAADHSIQFGEISASTGKPLMDNPAFVIEKNTGVKSSVLPLPIGLKNTDILLNRLREVTSECACAIDFPEYLKEERERLLDAYADVHKYCMGKSAVVYGEADFAAAVSSFLCELGIHPAFIVSGEKISSDDKKMIEDSIKHYGFSGTMIMDDSDFSDLDNILAECTEMPDFMIGNSKGYKTARAHDIPMVRAGFPVQDRFGGQRLLHLGYAGALRLTDEITNTLIARAQEKSPVGYMSM